MNEFFEEIEATLLYTCLPTPDFSAFCARLNEGKSSLAPTFTTANAPQDGYEILTSETLQLSVMSTAMPLGAECFMGAINPASNAATRAALTGIVARHSAHVTLTLTRNDDRPLSRANAQAMLRQTFAATSAFGEMHPPLAVHWETTNRLHRAEQMQDFSRTDTPLGLFLNFRNEVIGQRRAPALRVLGAEPWLGRSLHIQIGQLDREEAKSVARAFVEAAISDNAAPVRQSFHCQGHGFRIAHAPDGRRIDLIPTQQTLQIPGRDLSTPARIRH